MKNFFSIRFKDLFNSLINKGKERKEEKKIKIKRTSVTSSPVSVANNSRQE